MPPKVGGTGWGRESPTPLGFGPAGLSRGWLPLLNKVTGGDLIAKNTENLAIIYDDVELALGALAGKDAIAAPSKIDASRENGFRVMKTEYWMIFYGKTTAEGPIMVGLAPNLAAASIEETIEADPQSRTDDQVTPDSKRPVFPLEIIDYTEVDMTNLQPYKGEVKIRWSIPEGNNLNWFAYNMNAAGLTTGTVVRIFAKHYGVWLRD